MEDGAEQGATGRSRWTVPLVIAAAGAAAVLVMNASPLLPGLHSDGVQYLAAAEALARGEPPTIPVAGWAAESERSFLSHYPPGFSAVLAPVIAAGLPPTLAAVVVMALSAGATLALVFVLGCRLAGAAGGGAAVLLLALTPSWVRLHTAVWSEPLYLAFLLLTLLSLVRSPGRHGLHGLLAAACTAIRYVGVSVAVVAALAGAWRGATPRQKAMNALLALAPSLLFMGVWGGVVAGTESQVRRTGWYGGAGAMMGRVPTFLVEWLAPWRGGLPLALAAAVLIVAGAVFLWRRGRGRGLLALMALAALGHVALVVLSRLFADPAIPLNARMMIPLAVVAAVVAGAAVAEAASSGPALRRAALLAPVTAWSLLGGLAIHQGVASVQRGGQFYTSLFWFRSPLVGWVRERARSLPVVYSNEPELLNLHAGLPVRRLPVVGDDLAAFARTFERAPGPIVVVRPAHPRDLPLPVLLEPLSVRPEVVTDHGVVLLPRPDSASP